MTTITPEELRPFDPQGLVRRIAPFAGALLLAFSFVNLRHDDGGSPDTILLAAAIAAVIVLAVGAVPWRRLPTWTQTLPPLAFFVLVALLRDIDGGSSSAFAPLALLPVVWLALYGSRGQLLAGILGTVGVFLAPIVVLGAPQYAPDEWLTPTMWIVVAAFVGTVVHALVRETRTRAARVEAVASSDEVTSLPSRAAWDERLPRELVRARREGWPVCVALLDLDGFAAFEGAEGEAAADDLLREASLAWSQQLRGTDLLARLGSDSFGAAFPGCTLGAGVQLADRLRTVTPSGCTVSAGVACWDGDESADALMARARSALADAKHLGGDMVNAAQTA